MVNITLCEVEVMTLRRVLHVNCMVLCIVVKPHLLMAHLQYYCNSYICIQLRLTCSYSSSQ